MAKKILIVDDERHIVRLVQVDNQQLMCPGSSVDRAQDS
jgi:hypothetical protein